MKDKIGKLRQYFENKGITQEQIAEMLCVDKTYVNKLMLGKKAFGKQTARKWSDLFGLSYSWLLTGEGEMQNVAEAVPSTPEASNGVPYKIYEELLARYEAVVRENESLRVEIKNLRNGIGENADAKISIHFPFNPNGPASYPMSQDLVKEIGKEVERAAKAARSLKPIDKRKIIVPKSTKPGGSGNLGSPK